MCSSDLGPRARPPGSPHRSSTGRSGWSRVNPGSRRRDDASFAPVGLAARGRAAAARHRRWPGPLAALPGRPGAVCALPRSPDGRPPRPGRLRCRARAAAAAPGPAPRPRPGGAGRRSAARASSGSVRRGGRGSWSFGFVFTMAPVVPFLRASGREAPPVRARGASWRRSVRCAASARCPRSTAPPCTSGRPEAASFPAGP